MLRSLLVLLVLVPGFAAALRSRFSALVLYLWFALFRPQDWLWVDIASLRLSLVLGVVLLVPGVLTGVFPNVTHPLSIGMILFVCSTLLAQIEAVRPALGWEWIGLTVRMLLTCMLLTTLCGTPRRLTAVIAVISGSMGFHAAKAGLMWLVGGGEARFSDGLAGAFVDNNGYALGTVMIMPLLLVTAQNMALVYDGPHLRWFKRSFYLAVPLCAFTVLGTYSRGGFLALAASAIVFVVLQRRRFTAIAVALMVAGVAILVVPIPQSYLDRLETIRTYDKISEESALSRPHFWQVGIRMGMSRPFGVGLRQFEAAYDQFDFSHGLYGRHRAVHSSHVQVFAELGAAGAIVWTAMFAYAFVTCIRVRARSRSDNLSPESQRFLFTTANALATSMAGFLVGGAFLSLALNDITWLTFGMVAALDRTSAQLCGAPTVPVEGRQVDVPIAFRAVDSYAAFTRGSA